MEEGVEVGLAVLPQHVVDAHHVAGVEVVEVGVGLQVPEHRQQSHVVGRHDARQRRQVERRGGERDEGLSEFEQLGELFGVANAVPHVDAVLAALAVAGDRHFGLVAAVGSAGDAGGEGSVSAGDAVGVASRSGVLLEIEEVTVFSALPVGKVEAGRAGQALATGAAGALRRAQLASAST